MGMSIFTILFQKPAALSNLYIPRRYEKMLLERPKPTVSKRINAKPNYKFSVYSPVDLERLNSNIQSTLQSNYPNILFDTQTSTIMNSSGERLYCKAEWRATPIYIGKEDVLERILHSKKQSLQEYMSKRLKLKRLLKIDYFEVAANKL